VERKIQKLSNERAALAERAVELTGGERFTCERGAIEFAPIPYWEPDEKWFMENLPPEAKAMVTKLDLSKTALERIAQNTTLRLSDLLKHVKIGQKGMRVIFKPGK